MVVRPHHAPQPGEDQDPLPDRVAPLGQQVGQPQPVVEDARVQVGGAQRGRDGQVEVALDRVGLGDREAQDLARGVLGAGAHLGERLDDPLPGRGQPREGEGVHVQTGSVAGGGLALGGREQDEHACFSSERRVSWDGAQPGSCTEGPGCLPGVDAGRVLRAGEHPLVRRRTCTHGPRA